MSRTAPRLFSPLRSSTRVNLNAAARSFRPALNRRMLSSESHAGHSSASSDKPWIIGSALVFGPLLLYLLSPSARSGSHGHAEHGHKDHHDKHEDKHVEPAASHSDKPETTPISDDEGTEIPAEEVNASIEKAIEADSPKDAQEHEEVIAEAATTAVEKKYTPEEHSQVESPTETDHPTAGDGAPGTIISDGGESSKV